MNTIFNNKYKVDGSTIALILFTLSPVFSVSANSFTFRNIIIPFFLIIIFSMLNNVKLKLESTHLYALLLWVSAVLSTIVNNTVPQRNIFIYLLFVFLFILITAQKWDKNSLKLLFKIYIIVALISSLLIIAGVIFNVPYSFGRYSLDIIGLHKNPNYVGSFIIVAYSIVLYSLLYSKNNKLFKDWLLISTIIIMIIAVISTGTRASFLSALIITLFQLIMLIFKKSKNKMRTILIIFFLISTFGIFLSVFKEYIPLKTLSRVTDIETYGDGGSRLIAWRKVMIEFKESPILGTGIGGTTGFLKSQNTLGYLHNIYIELLFNQGILGITLFILLTLSKLSHINTEDIVIITTMGFAIFFPLSFQNGLIAGPLWWSIILFTLIVNYSRFNIHGLKDVFG